jgi:hypothetical protein
MPKISRVKLRYSHAFPQRESTLIGRIAPPGQRLWSAITSCHSPQTRDLGPLHAGTLLGSRCSKHPASSLWQPISSSKRRCACKILPFEWIGVWRKAAINIMDMHESHFARFAFGCAFLVGSLSHAQVSRVSPRVNGPINESDLTTLRGNVH